MQGFLNAPQAYNPNKHPVIVNPSEDTKLKQIPGVELAKRDSLTVMKLIMLNTCNKILILNSIRTRVKLKFPSTSKQKYNSKFQEFKTIRILKIQKKKTTKFGQKKHYPK